MRRFSVVFVVVLAAAFPFAPRAKADGPPPAHTPESPLAPASANDPALSINSDLAPAAPEPLLAEAPPEAPPPLPRKKGLVLEGALGGMGFAGQFRHVAPTAYFLHMQLGYEFLKWLMVFGESELAYTDTSIASDPSKTRAFPIYGFGGGARATVHASDRVAFFLQGSLGAMKADVPSHALALHAT